MKYMYRERERKRFLVRVHERGGREQAHTSMQYAPFPSPSPSPPSLFWFFFRDNYMWCVKNRVSEEAHGMKFCGDALLDPLPSRLCAQ